MKAAFDRKTFTDVLLRVAAVVPNRSPRPILANILLEATGERGNDCTLSATNLEQTLRLDTMANGITQPGKCLLRVDRMVPIVRSATGDEIDIEADASGVNVKSGRGKWRLQTENPSQYPTTQQDVTDGTGVFEAQPFVNALKLAATCCDEAETRYALSGVLLESQGDSGLNICGTDGRRMVVISMPGQVSCLSGIVPKTGVNTVDKLLAAGQVQVATNGSYFKAATQGCEALTRLTEGKWPKWQEITKLYNFAETCRLNSSSLLIAVQQAAVTSQDADGGTRIDFVFAQGLLTLRGTETIGSAVIELPLAADAYSGPELVFTAKPYYFREFLRAIGDRELICDVSLIERDNVLGSVALKSDNILYVVMGLVKN